MTRRAAAVVACLLVASVAGGLSAAAATAQPDVTGLTYVGDGAVQDGRDSLSLWQSSSHRFEATVQTSENRSDARTCLVAKPADGNATRSLDCHPVDLLANETTTVAASVADWPANLTGAQVVRLQLRASNGTVLAQDSLSLAVIQRDGDLDDDGLSNEREVAEGTRLRVADTDGDGLTDSMEVNTYGTNPTNNDTDGDGLSDGAEVNEYGTDPTDPDTDGDGLADPRELHLGTDPTDPDTDGDGLTDSAEVNRYQTDPTDPDTDDDGLDDGAEVNEYETNPTRADTDDDGLADNLEVNTYGTDPLKIDTDGDGLSDGAEVHQYGTDPTDPDTDGDGLSDGAEVNRYDTNPTDPDTDSDGLDDGAEVNEYGTDPTDPDTDDDGQSDLAEVNTSQPSELAWLLAGTALIVLAAVGGVLAYRSDRVSRADVWSAIPRSEPSENPDAASEDATAGPEDGDADSRAAVDASTGDEEVPAEFLSNDEQVLRLLDEHGGQIKQSTVVEETDWSKAKTSRVLSQMDDAGQVVKIELGRGNLVTRPDEVPPGAESSLEE